MVCFALWISCVHPDLPPGTHTSPTPVQVRLLATTDNTIAIRPTIAGDTLIYGDRDALRLLDLPTGVERWRRELGGAKDNFKVAAPIVVGDAIIAADTGRRLFGLAPATGEARWQRDMEALMLAPLTTDGEHVWVPLARSGLVAIDPENGETLWNLNHPVWWTSVVLRDPDLLCARSKVSQDMEQDGEILCLDRDTGEVRWRAESPGGGTSALVSLDDGSLLAGAYGGRVDLYDPSGKVVRTLNVSPGPQSDPLVQDDSAWIGLWSGDLIQISLPDLKVQQRIKLPVWTYARPALVCGQLVVVQYDGVARGFDPSTGKELWSTPLGGTPVNLPTLTWGDTVIVTTKQQIWALRPAACGPLADP